MFIKPLETKPEDFEVGMHVVSTRQSFKGTKRENDALEIDTVYRILDMDGDNLLLDYPHLGGYKIVRKRDDMVAVKKQSIFYLLFNVFN